MSHLLDFDATYKPPFRAPRPYQPETGREPMSELNNMGRAKVTEDYLDSRSAQERVDDAKIQAVAVTTTNATDDEWHIEL